MTTFYSFTFATGSGLDGWAAGTGTTLSGTPGTNGQYFYASSGGDSSVYKTLTGLTVGQLYTLQAVFSPDGSPGATIGVDGLATSAAVTTANATATATFIATATSHVLRATNKAPMFGGYIKSVTVTYTPPVPPFRPIDQLRLEVEDDPTGLVNLVQNPSGELGGYGWVTPVANTSMGTNPTGGRLRFTTTAAQAAYATTELVTLTAGQYVAASLLFPSSAGGYLKARFEYCDAGKALISSGAQTSLQSSSGSTKIQLGPELAPAGTAYARLRLDMYNSGGGTPAANDYAEVWQVTVAKAATSGALGTVRTNLIPNPSFETNTTGWAASTLSNITRVTTEFQTGTASLSSSSVEGGTRWARYAGIAVTGGLDYTLSAYVKSSVARTSKVVISWYGSSGTYISQSIGTEAATSTSAWTRFSVTGSAPSNALTATVYIYVIGAGPSEPHYIDAVMLEQASSVGTYFDGATTASGGFTYAWTGTAHASTSTATSSNLAYVEPVPYVNILGPSHDIKVVREALNAGTLTASVLDATLDPAVDNLIRPGRRVRLLALSAATSVWEPLFTGKMLNASVTYTLKDPDVLASKRARIEITAVDNSATLANQKRDEGVATIPELPYVLEGCGVPWNVNGSGNQVSTAIVVARNENASALDQVAITRDSRKGYAWVDRYGTLRAFDSASMPSATVATLSESVYTDLNVSFNTDDLINEVNVKWLRLNPTTGDTEEVPYGPYQDASSIATWGVHSAEFTVQGTDETAFNIPSYATSILTANATPVVRVNSLDFPIRTTADLSVSKALLDLYDKVTVSNTAKSINDSSRVTGIEHSITPDAWIVRLSFSKVGSVATPTVTPSPPQGAGGLTIGQLLRPVGEVTMHAGATAPTGWLKCDGTSKLVADYPALHAVIGYTFGGSGASFNLPNFTDKFPIGAGTKALGTTGGDATKPVPAHTHSNTLATGTTGSSHDHPIPGQPAGGTYWLVGNSGANNATSKGIFEGHNHGGLTGTNGSGHTHNVTGSVDAVNSGASFDVMNPWLSLNFIIRAV